MFNIYIIMTEQESFQLPQEENEWTIYGASWCGPCKRIKKYMKAKQFQFKYYDLGEREDAKKAMDLLSHSTNNYQMIPMVFHKTKFVGGGTDTVKYIRELEGKDE